MQRAVFSVPTCTNCKKWLGLRVELVRSDSGDYSCPRGCGMVKNLIFIPGMSKHRLLFASESMIAFALSIGGALFKMSLYWISILPLAFLIAPLFLTAYVLISYRILLGVKEAVRLKQSVG